MLGFFLYSTTHTHSTLTSDRNFFISRSDVSHIPVQRGDVFVARHVLTSFSDAVAQDQLGGASRAALAQVPDPRRRVA